jgi:ABC-type glycerol-3-phosphate transport system substrate-binding protein
MKIFGTRSVMHGFSACILCASLAACGVTHSESSPQKPVTLTFAVPTGATNFYYTLARNFHKSHPSITVKVETIPFANYDSTVETDMRGGAGPDIVIINYVDVAGWKSAGYLLNLTPDLKDSRVATNSFAHGIYSDATINGKQYGIPIAMGATALYYNKKLFQQYSLAPPTTWNVLLSDAKVLHQHGVYAVAALMANNWGGVWQETGNFLLSNGGRILNQAGTKAIAADDPRTVQAYKFFFDKLAPYAPPGISDMGIGTITSLFAEGKLATWESEPGFLTAVESDNPKMKNDIGIIPLPKSPTGHAVSMSGGFLVGIWKNSPHQKQALQFLNYIIRPKFNSSWATEYGSMPTWLPEYKSSPWNNPIYKPFVAAIPTAQAPVNPLIPQESAIVTLLWKQLQLIAGHSESVIRGLTRFDKQANQLLGNS